jgi:aconitase A
MTHRTLIAVEKLQSAQIVCTYMCMPCIGYWGGLELKLYISKALLH